MTLEDLKKLPRWMDVDGIYADFVSHIFARFNLLSHPPIIWDDPRIIDNFHLIADDHDFWLSIPPINQGLGLPITGYITSRPIPSDVTAAWLEKHGFPQAEVITVKPRGSKGAILKEKGSCVLVDDAAHNYEDAWSHGVPCILLDTTYNRHIDTPYRIYNLNELE